MDNSLALPRTIMLDKQALVTIYEDHSPGLYRYAYRLLGDVHLAEECVAETFHRLLQAVRSGGGPAENVKGYLYRIAHNWITDQYRRNRPVEQLEEDLHVDPQGNPAEQFLTGSDADRVRKALLHLPEEQRKVVLLRVLDGWSHEDVAVALGKTVEATRALQHRALSALRRMLVDQEEVL